MFLALSFAGGCASDSIIEPVRPDDVPRVGPVRAVVPVPFPEEGFEVFQLTQRALGPVVAITPDHSLFYAYIDPDSMWPSVTAAEGAPLALPGERLTTNAVALTASNDGFLHLLWDGGTAIRYTRLGPDGVFDSTEALSAEGASEPNLIIAPGGEVIAGWVEPGPEGEPARVRLAIGHPSDDGVSFEGPTTVNAGCCADPEPAYAMSGPSIAAGPDGSVHVVYEWSSFGRTVIDYVVHRDGAWSTPLVISEAAFSPCPAIALDADGRAHISFIRELETGVLHASVLDGVVSEARVIYQPESGRATLAMLALDADGTAHLGVTESGSMQRLIYLQIEDLNDASPELNVIHEQESGRVSLTPRAGGMLIAPDAKLLFAFQSRDGDDANGHVAMGR